MRASIIFVILWTVLANTLTSHASAATPIPPAMPTYHPSATPIIPTESESETDIPIVPTATPIPPTATFAPPTATPVTPTNVPTIEVSPTPIATQPQTVAPTLTPTSEVVRVDSLILSYRKGASD